MTVTRVAPTIAGYYCVAEIEPRPEGIVRMFLEGAECFSDAIFATEHAERIGMALIQANQNPPYPPRSVVLYAKHGHKMVRLNTNDDLTPDEAEQLGMALIRAAGYVRGNK